MCIYLLLHVGHIIRVVQVHCKYVHKVEVIGGNQCCE